MPGTPLSRWLPGGLLGLAAILALLLAACAAPIDVVPPTAPPVPTPETRAPAAEPTATPRPEPTATPRPEPSPTAPPRLSVESDPAGATVLVDGADQGSTPLVLERLETGLHRVHLSLAGWKEWEELVFLAPGDSMRLSVPLEESPAEAQSGPRDPFYPLAIMVENMVDARPQSGLARADIVYEVLVEGGITRFMAIYVDGEAETIGPVRSARHYFAYLAGEYNASYVFIGASPQGYETLSAVPIVTLDETFGDPGFWRSRARYAPHNAYTSTDLLRRSLDRVRQVSPGGLAGFRFRESAKPVEGPEALSVRLVYPGGYEVRYEYSPEEKVYYRFMEGLRHLDADSGDQVAPRNVVVQYMPAWLIPGDDKGRLDMEQLGEGKALYFRDGVATEGFWQKVSYGDVTEWYDSDWKPVLMNPGKTWVQIIPPGGKVGY